MTNPAPSDELLARYFANEASGAERAAVDAWASADPANQTELGRLRRAWSRPTTPGAWDVERAWSKVSRVVDEERPADAKAPAAAAQRGRPDPRVVSFAARVLARRSALLRVAAAAVLIAGIAYIWRPWRTSPLRETQVFATAPGERTDIELLDGTRVTLGPASELRVVAGFGGTERNVNLIGEAWFNVQHDAGRPFEVHAGTTITRDIGTAFAIRALPGDSVVRVVMIEGQASLRHADLEVGDAVMLGVNDVGVMHAASRTATVQRGADIQSLVAWRTGSLEFDDAPLRDVAVELARWYGVVIQFGDSATGARRYSGPVPTADLPEAQRALETALGVRITRSGGTLFIR